MVRAFVAIELPEEIREQISRAQQILLQSDARLTPVNPRQAHVTLKFLGEIPDGIVDDVIGSLETITHAPFRATAGRVVPRPPRQPRVIWAEIEDLGQCRDLHRKIEDALAPLGIRRDRRPFTPHATVARVRRFDPSLMTRLNELALVRCGIFEVNGFVLKKSTLTPAGPIYEDLAEVAFI
ncbi:MAG: RNA 2',3'-cyclic phosphodiesterase [Methanoculleaceae archaeon]